MVINFLGNDSKICYKFISDHKQFTLKKHPVQDKLTKFIKSKIKSQKYSYTLSSSSLNKHLHPGIFISFLDFLNNNDHTTFESIIHHCGYNTNQYAALLQIIQNKKYDESTINWFNTDGRKLTNIMYFMIKDKKINSKITDMFFFNNSNNLSDIYGSFISFDVLSQIETHFGNINYIQYSNNTNISLKIGLKDMSIRQDFVNEIIFRILLIHSLGKNTCTEFDISMWLTDLKKQIHQQKLLGPREMNTASTTISNCNNVTIWRKEECLKVLVHELFHCLNYDFHENTTIIEEYLKKVLLIPLDTEIRIYEAYVETWACILNCYLCAYRIDKNFEKNAYMFLEYETEFACFQVAKILKFFNFNNFNEFYNQTGFEKRYDNFIQTSSAISYYIIKSSFLFSCNKFLAFCDSNNTNFFKFTESPQSLNLFLELIKKSISNTKYIKKINYYFDILSNPLPNKFISKTLRMTCIEIL